MDYKRLLTQVERTLEQIDTTESPLTTVAQIAETIAANFRDELGITGGRVYESNEDCYELVARFGPEHDGELGIQVPKDYKPIELVIENGIVVMDPSDAGYDPILESKLGAQRFCAIAVADEDYIIAFNVSPELGREDILFSLNLIRYAINQKVRAQWYESLIVEAQRIQQSILPQRVPQYEGYDIWGAPCPRRSSAATSTTTSRSPTTSSAWPSRTAPGTGCPRPWWCVTSTWACAWPPTATSRSSARCRS
jgi:hypothetical protein